MTLYILLSGWSLVQVLALTTPIANYMHIYTICKFFFGEKSSTAKQKQINKTAVDVAVSRFVLLKIK